MSSHGTASIPSSVINAEYFSNDTTSFQPSTTSETIIQVGNLQAPTTSIHAESHHHHHHHEHHHGEHKHKEKHHHHHHHEHSNCESCGDSEHHHHHENEKHNSKHKHSHSHSHHDHSHHHGHHHHHDHHGHDHHHHHHGIQLPDLRVWIPRLKRWILLLVQHSIQEHTRKLFYFTLSLLGMFFIQLFMAMFVSKALVIFIAAFHTLQRAFHHLITLIMRAVSVANSAPSTPSTNTKCQLTAFTYGYERMEVVMRFANGIFSIFFSFALSTEAIHRILEGEKVSFKFVMLITLLSLVQNLGGVYLFSSYGSAKQFTSFVKSKTVQSSTMFGSNASKNLLTKSKKRQLFSDILFEITPHVVVFLTVILSELISPAYLDPIFAVVTALVIVYFAFPTITSAATILLQTSPQKMKGALSKCLREASTIEGVLECQSFNVWSLSYGLGNLVGTLSIRVAEDADEQKVLNSVHQLFNPLFADLTIQVQKYFKSEAPLPLSPKISMQPISLMSEPLIQEKPFLTLSQPQEMPTFSVVVENPSLSENMRQRSAETATYPEMLSVAGESHVESKED